MKNNVHSLVKKAARKDIEEIKKSVSNLENSLNKVETLEAEMKLLNGLIHYVQKKTNLLKLKISLK